MCELAAEIADGWLPIFFSPRHYDAVYREHIEAGFAKAGSGKSYDQFDIAPSVAVVLGDDVDSCRDMRQADAGALYRRDGRARQKFLQRSRLPLRLRSKPPRTVQDLYLAGQRGEATAAVPDALVDDVALCGPKERIAERLALWRSCPITTFNVVLPDGDLDSLRMMAELAL